MSPDTYWAMTMAIGVGALLALGVALYSLAMMLIRWKTPQRKRHVVRLLMAVVAVPCLVGLFQAFAWLVFMPAVGREQMAKIEAVRAERLAESSFIHVGDPAPDFALIDADGAEFSMAGAQGNVVLLNFFATWCGPCIVELPHIEEIWTEHHDSEGFELLVIGREESMQSVREFRAERGFSFPIAPDPDREVYSLFAEQYIPRTIVVAPDGTVVYSKSGFMEDDLDELTSVLAEQIERRQR